MNEQEFERLLRICRIKLQDAEREKIKKDIESVLDYFDTIQQIDTGNIAEQYHPIPIDQRLRQDSESAFEDVDLLLANSRTHRFYVVGPKI
ncbi:MAG: Asp-tRNA(Asn)/Glu-tRNA(Gln) amidotransferase subunit GatC [Candidatus Marsarchaeota archaeon]|nr:Asp-tRNA(Asn)/Glu-tRNA(Gln) amidotransferase subunit GatC [Candidatus Marsarchaeota archaeon]MCL5106399.1 Asp-tRNA(Asn)/Glu-tRNA(Gln) amidotransferase subunit GatC [Candidatus Marsarchaeota archaeon]